GGAVQSGTLDTLAPTLTLDTVGATNNSTPTISGTSNAPAGTVITINVTDAENTETFTATVQADGSWSADVPNALTDGELTIEASVSDSAGNTTTLSEGATLDTNAPSINIDALMDTNDTTPNVSGTSSAANGTIITVSFTDSNDITNTVQTTVADGIWSVEAPVDLAEGSYEVEASVTDGSGNTSTATENGVVDTTIPNIAVNDVTVTDDTTPTITGTANAPQGSTVSVEITDSNNISHTVTTTLGVNGTWSVAATQVLAEGTFTVSASVSDAAGNEATATGAGEIDTIAPTLELTSPGSSNDITPTLNGTSDAVEGTVINFTVVDDQGNTQTFTTTVDADGNFSIEVPTALAEGPYSIEASISDVAGNSTEITGTGTIDTTAPSVSVDAPVLTNDSTPTVIGTSDAPNSTITVTFTDAANATQSIDVQTDANGNWSATPTTDLAEGSYSVSASITDAAGNTGTGTDSGEVDITPPDLRIIPAFATGNLVSLSGTSDLPEGSVVTITEHLVGGLLGVTYTATTDADGSWVVANITVPLLGLAYVTASASDAAGNVVTVNSLDFDSEAPTLTVTVDALSNDATPVISGVTDMEEGTAIQLTVVDSAEQSQEFTAIVQANGGWSVEVPTELSQGQYTVTAEVSDEVGNLTSEQAQGEIDSIAPTLSVNPIDTTADTTPIISGTSDAIGADVIVNIDGQTFFAVVGAEGNWQVEVPTALTDGSYTAQINVADEANNITNTTIDLVIDTQIPVVVLDDITVFNTDTPIISGTSTEPTGTNVDIVITDSNGDTHTLLATVDASGNWQTTAPSLPDGNYDVVVSITDDAGNTGSDSGSSLVDTQAPSITIDALGTINNSTPTITGSSNEAEGTLVTVTITDGDSTDTYTTAVAAGGGWSLDVTTPLTDGQVTVSASITDTAGNTSSAEATATLNTNAPTININTIVDTNDQTPAISGTSSAADNTEITVVITDVNNASQTITTTVVGGVWSVDATNILPEGEFTVSASVTEGGLTSNAAGEGVIDLTAPALSINTLITANDTTPTILGTTTAPQGAIVVILITDSLGVEQTVNATVGANGTWSVAAPSALSEGVFSVNASTTDTAGNPVSTSATGTLDITAPIVTINDIVGSIDLTPSVSGSVTGATVGDSVVVVFIDAQGNEHSVNTTVQAGGTWTVEASNSLSQGDYSVEVFITDNAGNTGDALVSATIDTIAPEISIDQSSLVLTQDNTPLISGTSNEANTNVIVTFTDSAGASHQMTVQTDANGDWQAAADNILADGVYSVSATISDDAGNTSTDSKTGGEVDTVGPELTIVPSYLLGGLVTLSGTSDLGADQIVTVTNYLLSGLVGATYEVQTDANGDWELLGVSLNLLNLAYVTASASDEAGNQTTVSTGEVDNTPALLTADFSFDSGDNTPTISGTTDLAAGEEVLVVITDGDGVEQTLNAVVDGDSQWAVTVTQALAEGEFNIVVTVVNDVGLITTQLLSDVVDTIPPSLTVNAIETTSDATPLIQGTSDLINAVVTVSLEDELLNATVNALGNWSVEASVLEDGEHVAELTITDDAGNTTSETLVFIVDTIAPVFDVLPLTVGNLDVLTLSGTSTEDAGSEIQVSVIDSNLVEHNYTALIQPDGSWSILTDGLPDGAFDVVLTMADEVGNTTSETLDGVIDTLAPDLILNDLGVINTLLPTISGTTNEAVGSIVNLVVTDSGNNRYEFSTAVLGDGSWTTMVPTALLEGAIDIIASITDAAGNITTATDNATVNTTLPGLTIDPLGVTNDQMPTITGNTVAINSLVSVVVTDELGNEFNYSTTSDLLGNWSIDVTDTLSEGDFSVSASVSWLGLSNEVTTNGEIDITAPSIVINELAATNDNTPLISGSSNADAGTLIILTFLDAALVDHSVQTNVDNEGNWEVSASQALAEGDYFVNASITDTAGNEANTIAASSTDYTGPVINISEQPNSLDVTPTVSGTVSGHAANALVTVQFTDQQGVVHSATGFVENDGTWSVEANQSLAQGEFSYSVEITDDVDNTSIATSSTLLDSIATVEILNSLTTIYDSTPTLYGTSSDGNTTITISVINPFSSWGEKGFYYESYTTTTDENGEWSIELSEELLYDDNYNFTATLTDEFGNTGTDSTSMTLSSDLDSEFQVLGNKSLLGLGLLLPTVYGSSEAGAEVFVIGDGLISLGALGLDLDILTNSYSVIADNNGYWESDTSLIDLDLLGDSSLYFATIEDGHLIVIDENQNLIMYEEYDSEAAPESVDNEIAMADLLVSNEPNTLVNEEGQQLGDSLLGESVDLSNIIAATTNEPTANNEVSLTIEDVLSDDEGEKLLALVENSEQQSLAFDQQQVFNAEPAADVQIQSEELIKSLIESGNNQIDM
ncbi:hypothetical protein EU510_00005, partial [Pseudoalteromonas sp. FUC4]|uniref:Ig-like domain-containing protein n=1 Tax=Pseudoalteromonas sp. FUC4 TaxID=2511201 RepID=UPI0012583DA1